MMDVFKRSWIAAVSLQACVRPPLWPGRAQPCKLEEFMSATPNREQMLLFEGALCVPLLSSLWDKDVNIIPC